MKSKRNIQELRIASKGIPVAKSDGSRRMSDSLSSPDDERDDSGTDHQDDAERDEASNQSRRH